MSMTSKFIGKVYTFAEIYEATRQQYCSVSVDLHRIPCLTKLRTGRKNNNASAFANALALWN
jgi:hypothetical protein